MTFDDMITMAIDGFRRFRRASWVKGCWIRRYCKNFYIDENGEQYYFGPSDMAADDWEVVK